MHLRSLGARSILVLIMMASGLIGVTVCDGFRIAGLGVCRVIQRNKLSTLLTTNLPQRRVGRHSADFFGVRSVFKSGSPFSSSPSLSASVSSPFEAAKPISLAAKHRHLLDDTILFNESTHIYTIGGCRSKYSVTGAISFFFGKFDAKKIIAGMMAKPDWPRPEYVKADGSVMTPAEITSMWNAYGLQTRIDGQKMHSEIEDFINYGVSNQTSKEIQQFKAFHQQHVLDKGMESFRTEWRIAIPEGNLAGSVDYVAKAPDGSLALFDWKRSSKFASWKDAFGKKCNVPISHLADCDASKHSLQLNMYRYILQQYYGYRVSSMCVCAFHPDYDSYQQMEVPLLEQEIKAIVAHLNLASRNERHY